VSAGSVQTAISRLLWHRIYEIKKVMAAVTANNYVVPYEHSDDARYLCRRPLYIAELL